MRLGKLALHPLGLLSFFFAALHTIVSRLLLLEGRGGLLLVVVVVVLLSDDLLVAALAVLLLVVVAVRVLDALQLLEDLFVLWRAFLRRDQVRPALKVE